jgi:hypothetical protein
VVLREGPPFYKKRRRDLLYGQTDVHEDDAPVLLALSGIGPRTELKGAGIPVVDDLPGVGKQFSD